MDKSFYRKIALLVLIAIAFTALLIVGIKCLENKTPKRIEPANTKENITEGRNNPDMVSFIAVGDISFSRGVERVVKYQKDINYPFLKTKHILGNADFTYGNLETPITEGPEIPDGSMEFRSNPGTENALKWAGFDIVNLANNHTYNYGEKGLLDTLNYLNKAEIKYVGAGENKTQAYEPLFFSKNDIKFALLSYEEADIVPADYEATINKPGIAIMKIEEMKTAVRKCKEQADIVIVAMHAGEEYVPYGNDLQTAFAHAAIEAGAEIVLGDHPHVVQNAEIYKGKVIFYNLGNFVMDQMWSDDTRRSLIFKGNFDKDGLDSFELFPVLIENYSQPNPVEGTIADATIKRLQIPIKKDYLVSYTSEKKTYQKKPRYSYKLRQNELVNLNQGKATIKVRDELIWESPKDWHVTQIKMAQSLNDGRELVNMMVWKKGNYGESKPLWETNNDTSVKSHLFVFELKDKQLKPVWQSSNLPAPNCDIDFYDANNDGQIELIAYEGDYGLNGNQNVCITTSIAVFKWKEWGFYNEWREGVN